MLSDREIIKSIQSQASGLSSCFDINIFLHTLQSTTRPMGYPDYRQAINPSFYISHLRAQIQNAKACRNGHQYQALMHVLSLCLGSFCYIHEALNLLKIEESLLLVLNQAIEQRDDTTDEERCAEKSLLACFIHKPVELFSLFAEYWHQLPAVNIQQLYVTQITELMNKKFKRYVAAIPDTLSIAEIKDLSSEQFVFLGQPMQALSSLKPYSINNKKHGLVVIGQYLNQLSTDQRPRDNEQIEQFVKRALVSYEKSCRKNEAKSKLMTYIQQRNSESNGLAFFRSYPKNIKLEAAQKLLLSLESELQPQFDVAEQGAYLDDAGSRLHTIYCDYADLFGNATRMHL